ncbi:MAG TPA: allantoinase AllB [Polyangiales bacterium]|nr:allantoinase AllB [Polyangiales bacterium]
MRAWALHSTRIVAGDALVAGHVLVGRDGRIAGVTHDEPPAEYARLDAGGLVVSPGLVDCHVHVNEPGRTDWEGYETATQAAAAGGVTSLVDMPLNCIPVTTTADALQHKLAACRGKCFVDVGFWGGVVPGNAPELPALAADGVLGCKAFLVHSGIDEFPNATREDLRRAMPLLRAAGIPLLAHAELDLGADVSETDPRAYRGYLESRPTAWEDAAIAQLIELARETGCHVHIVHLSAATSIPQLRAAKAEGLPISVETCPHYLCLEAETIPDGATQFKCAPPIRGRENREALWGALFEGVIDFVITDHSPCTPQLKQFERGHFHDAWGGIASLQLGLPALWTHARARGATLQELARWTSEAPARFAGVGARKGKIASGYDADLVVWDPDAAFNVRAERLFFKHRISPYLGLDLQGLVHHTYLRGVEVFDGSRATHPAGAVGALLLGRDARAGR